MPTIGSYFSEPSDRFRVIRGWVTHWRLRQNNDNFPPVWNGSQFVWPSVGFPHIVQYATILPEFNPWSSNAYTLDHIITEYYYTSAPSPTPIPNAGLVLRYVWDTTLNAMVLELQKEFPDTVAYFDLSGGVGGYWLDPIPS